MEMHSQQNLDVEPTLRPTPSEVGKWVTDVTLVEGSRRVAMRRIAEKEMMHEASNHALEVFLSVAEIGERDLVAAVNEAFPSLPAGVAFAVVDDLRSRGISRKDWTTGLLTPV